MERLSVKMHREEPRAANTSNAECLYKFRLECAFVGLYTVKWENASEQLYLLR